MWIVWLEKKILKTLGIILGVIIVLVTALHIYVVNNAEKLIEDLVKTSSKDKLRLKVENIKFNYFTRKIELQRVSFYSNDSLDLSTSYKFNIKSIKLRVKALIPIFTRKELLIDSIFLTEPDITVTQLKASESATKKDVSIPEEMGKIYNSVIDALKLLQVSRFELNDGKFTLKNKIIPDQVPLTISNLHIHIDNFKVDDSSDASKLLIGDQMVFRTRDQDILFPDGKHRLAFSRFRINIKKKIIEIDSCTLSAKRTNDNRSGFNIFLDTLLLMNVDFGALYERELIKADSVFCRNPSFKIVLEHNEKSSGNKKLPNIDTLIQQLTGDLSLKYVGVTNAAIDFSSENKGNTTSFTSDHNNFEMTGLSVDQRAARPVSLEGFDMAINNYENYLKDSSHIIRFDSIRLREKRILLSNFSINTEPYIDNRNIKVRQFVLSGLSWPDLLFNRKLVASQATLISPVIDYVQTKSNKQKKSGPIVASLAVINDLVNLDKLQIENGKINIQTRKNVKINLDDANLFINSKRLADTLSVENAESIVESLDCKKAVIKTKNLMINVTNLKFSGISKHLTLDKLKVYNNEQTFNINTTGLKVDSTFYSDKLAKISVKGISWENANIEINSIPSDKDPNKKPVSFELKNISGAKTLFNLNSTTGSLSAFLNSITATSLNKNEKIHVDGLKADAKDLSWFNQQSNFSATTLKIEDNSNSVITALQYKQTKGANTSEIKIPVLNFTPDIKSILTKTPDIKNVRITRPEIRIHTGERTAEKISKALPDLIIDSIEIINPVFKMENSVSKGLSLLEWNGSNNRMFLQNIQSSKSTNQLSVSSLETNLSDILFADSLGKKTSSKKVTVNTDIENILFQQGEKPVWTATINELIARNFYADSLGKKPSKVKVDSITIKDFLIGSEYITSLPVLIKKNPSFTVSNISGYYIDQKNNWQWHNLNFSKTTKSISLDSFSYHPVPDLHSFVAASPYQTDYMTLKTGSINISDFDIDHYLGDSIIGIGNMNITHPYFTSYRDKHPPFNAGIIKPFVSKALQKIKLKVSIDTILIHDGTVVYTEFSNKTDETGVIPVTRISGDIFPIKNYDLVETDTLRIRLNAYLMDSAWLRLRVRESYYDSLSGFLITLRMRPGSLMYLNPALVPLASVKLSSGWLDTLSLRAVGQEYLAFGEMKMYYHDLKVQFLSNGSEDKKSFLKGLMTFVANSFVIKNSNKKRKGVVYFPRIRDRSFINYYIKITMSGMASSVGAKKNRKLMRKYKKQLKTHKLPPIDYE